MKDFEKLLTDLPKPDVDVRTFKRQLRRELLSARVAAPGFGFRLALGAAASLAVAFGLLLTLFVASPGIPARIHEVVTGGAAGAGEAPGTAAGASATLAAVPMREGLQQTGASVELDQAFIEDWSARQDQPVRIRSMEAEKIYTVRRFELTNGKRMIVFTELGDDRVDYRLASLSGVPEVF